MSKLITDVMIKKIELHKDAIAKHRDALRDICADLKSVLQSTDTAVEELELAIQTLSEYL